MKISFSWPQFLCLVIVANGQSQEYGPPNYTPGKPTQQKQQPPQYGPESKSPETDYGPPSFTPGKPLGEYSSSSSNNQGKGTCRNTDREANKRVVTTFYQEVFGDKKFDQLDKYIAEDVINHNPMEVDGIESLREVLQGPLGQGPRMKIDIMRVAAEDDLVWTHTRLPVPALGITYAAADIFRINCGGLIAEHWDVLQDTSVETKNPHPFF